MFIDDILNGFIVDFEDPSYIPSSAFSWFQLYPPGNIIVPNLVFGFTFSYTYNIILVVEESSRYNNILPKLNVSISLHGIPRLGELEGGGGGGGAVVSELKGNTFQIVVPFYTHIQSVFSHYKFPSFLNWIATASKTYSVIISWVQQLTQISCL